MQVRIKHRPTGEIFNNIVDFAAFHYKQGTAADWKKKLIDRDFDFDKREYVIWCDLETLAFGLDGNLYLLDETNKYILIDENEYKILNKRQLIEHFENNIKAILK